MYVYFLRTWYCDEIKFARMVYFPEVANVCMSINKNRLVLANAFLKLKLRSILYNVCATAVGGFAARFLSFRGNYI